MEIQMKGDRPEAPTSFREELSGSSKALARASAALYPVDVRGLVAPAGGQTVVAVAESESKRHYSITLGFYPDPSGQDGNYQGLHIDVKRPGVQLRYREGYVAADAQLPLLEAGGRDSIRDALASPVDVAGIPLTVRIQPRDPKKPDALRLTIAIPAKDIDLRPPENGVVATLDVIVAQHAADGSDLATFGDVVRVHPGEQRGETPLREGLLIRREVPVREGVASVRVVVFDRGSGRIGSLALPPPK
jgi:hypothetical protein